MFMYDNLKTGSKLFLPLLSYGLQAVRSIPGRLFPIHASILFEKVLRACSVSAAGPSFLHCVVLASSNSNRFCESSEQYPSHTSKIYVVRSKRLVAEMGHYSTSRYKLSFWPATFHVHCHYLGTSTHTSQNFCRRYFFRAIVKPPPNRHWGKIFKYSWEYLTYETKAHIYSIWVATHNRQLMVLQRSELQGDGVIE